MINNEMLNEPDCAEQLAKARELRGADHEGDSSMKEYIDPIVLVTYLRDADEARSPLCVQAADALEELIEANNELSAAVIRSGAEIRHLIEALKRISTGDEGDWSCSCPAHWIAKQVLEELQAARSSR